jgi:co-chaperonin GroES (HSP10)
MRFRPLHDRIVAIGAYERTAGRPLMKVCPLCDRILAERLAELDDEGRIALREEDAQAILENQGE